MNKGTKIRTVAFIVSVINMSISQLGDIDFGNEIVNLIYKIVSVIFSIIAGGFALYYNNDFSEEACIGTGITRQLKAQREEGYNLENFEDEVEEIFEDEEEGEENA